MLGGRWLHQTYKGELMGQPFEGMGLMGYDNFRKMYLSSWIDNASTTLVKTTGSIDAAGTTFTMTGLIDEPTTGEKDKKLREVVKWTGPDQFVFEMYDTSSGKADVRVLEITHVRAR